MSYTYNSFVAALGNFLVVPLDDPNFIAAIPSIIADAEQRLLRELDLQESRVGDETLVMVANQFGYSLPTPSGGNGPFVVVETINVITPVGTVVETGTLNPLDPVSKETLFALWPSTSGAGIPKMFAMGNQNSFIVGPRPDAAYRVHITGTVRLAPLSFDNQTTYLSQYLPDVFFAAALVMSAGYQLNFSPAGDNPAAGMTWEAHVKTLIDSAKVEEIRKKFGSQGWTSKEPDALATPPRT